MDSFKSEPLFGTLAAEGLVTAGWRRSENAREKVFFIPENGGILKRIPKAHKRASSLRERIQFINGEGPTELRAKVDATEELEKLQALRGVPGTGRPAAAQERMLLLRHA